MRISILIAAAAVALTSAGCIDFPVDEMDGTARRRRAQAPSREVVYVPSGTTNLYVSEPVTYAGPIVTDYQRVRRRSYGNFNVYGTGTYRGVNYGVGYGGGSRYGYDYSGGYGWANGTKGKTSWSASWGYPTYYGGYGGSRSSGIYGNGNGYQGGTPPSRFSIYR